MSPMNARPKDMLDQVVITYSLKHLPCSKADCVTCLTTNGHGPYWYAHFTLEGVEKNIFLGKSFKPMDLTQILLGEIAKGIKGSAVNQEEEARAYESAQLHTEGFQKKPKAASKAPNRPKKAPAFATPNHLVDRIGTVKRQKPKRQKGPKLSPPTPSDFDQDLRLLKGAARSENLKLVYRKLIKKYHPDQYDSSPLLDEWMSQINGVYQKLALAQVQ